MDLAKKEQWNILTPAVSMEGLSEFHKPVVEVVRLSPLKEQGDVYPASNSDDGGGKVRLSGKGIEKLSMAACVMWNLDYSKRTDDRSDDDYVSWQAVGGIRKPDGTVVWMKAEYDLDIRVLEDEMVEQARSRHAKAVKGGKDWAKKQPVDDYVKYCVTRDLPQKRKHRLKLAETGARNRVIRALLGLKNEYTVAEVQKPFVLARIVFQPDYTDPTVKTAMLAAFIQSTTGVFGPTVATQAPACQPIDIPKSDYQVMDPDAPHGNGDEPQGQPTEAPDKIESQAADFNSQSTDEQVQTLEKLIRQKGYDYDGCFTSLNKPVIALKDLSQGNKDNLFRRLIDMEDNDIPF